MIDIASIDDLLITTVTHLCFVIISVSAGACENAVISLREVACNSLFRIYITCLSRHGGAHL